MTDKARRVLRGYTELSDQERKWLKREIEQYETASFAEKTAKRNMQESVVLGPLDRGCPCCGR